jgi:transcription elongation factor Elf1
VTGCPPATRFLCQDCGDAVEVPGEDEAEIGLPHVDCPVCGQVTPGRFGHGGRCVHCGTPLDPQIEGDPLPENVLRCDRCRTRYDVSRYGPGTRFRCRTCGTELRLPLRGRWLGAGEWELDVDSGWLRCNGCGRGYDVAGRTGKAAFVCRPCHRVFLLPDVLPDPTDVGGTAGDEWELDVDAGLVRCNGCGYSYDVSLYAGESDFTCPRCTTVFRMPRIVKSRAAGTGRPALAEREIILCNRCGAIHDVSDYPRGTLFSCDGCGGVLRVSGVPGEWEVDAGRQALVCSACGYHHDLRQVAGDAPLRACAKCHNPFRLAAPAETEVNPRPAGGAEPGDAGREVPTPAPVADADVAVVPSASVLRCGGCGTRFDIAALTPGARFRCAGCQGVIVVPSAAEAPGAAQPEAPPVFSDVPAAVREGRAVLLECRRCHVAYEVPAHMARARLRCKACRQPVTLRETPVTGPDPLDAGHDVEVIRSGARPR